MKRATVTALLALLGASCGTPSPQETSAPVERNALRCEEGRKDKMCAVQAATLTGDGRFCEIAPDELRAMCYERTAEAALDPSLCLKLATDGKRDTCIRRAITDSGDPQECKKLPPKYKDECLIQLNKRVRAPEICREIEDAKAKARCIAEMAKDARRPELCDEIDEDDEKDACRKPAIVRSGNAFAACMRANPDDVEACVRFLEHKSARGCLNQPFDCAPVTWGSAEQCAALDKYKGRCYSAFAIARHDPSYCDETMTERNRITCLLEVGETLQHTESCLKLDAGRRERCANAIFQRAQDPRLCAFVSKRNQKSCQRALKQ